MADKKTVTEKVLSFNPFRRMSDLKAKDVAEARRFIADYWPKLERFHPKDDETLVGLPKPTLYPPTKKAMNSISMSCTIGTVTSWLKESWMSHIVTW